MAKEACFPQGERGCEGRSGGHCRGRLAGLVFWAATSPGVRAVARIPSQSCSDPDGAGFAFAGSCMPVQ